MAVFALVFAQIAISSHAHNTAYQVAAYHDVSSDHDHIDNTENDSERRPHECPECLLTKSLQKTIPQADAVYTPFSGGHDLSTFYSSPFLPPVTSDPYQARAPPFFLI